jgi:hypothetical protein
LTLAKSIDIQILTNTRGTLLPALLLPNFSEFSLPKSIIAFSKIPPTINTKGKGRSNIIKAAISTQNQYNRSSKGIYEIPFIISPNFDNEQWKNSLIQPTQSSIL